MKGSLPVIQQVLNKRLLTDVLSSMHSVVQVDFGNNRRTTRADPLAGISKADRADLLGNIDRAHNFCSSKQENASERRGARRDDVSMADSLAYIPRSPEVSNLQAAIERYFLEKRPSDIDTQSSTDRRGTSLQNAGAQITLTPWKDYDSDRRLGGAFEQTDIRWISAWFAEGIRKFRRKHKFIARPVRQAPITLPDDKLRMIVFGDWGSGIPRAQKVSSRIREELDEGDKKGLQQHVVHLGDVYYAGWQYEYEKRFLKDWPVELSKKTTIGSFTLNGNHDMYSGGHAYFEVALADPRFATWQGKSSLFHLANNHWQIFGLDTSYDDADLKDDQVDWVRGAARKGLKTMLLSHHQYCSSYEAKDVSKMLVKKIQPALKDLEVATWLWGHEHRCMTYKNVPRIRFPRCLGHGGVPVYQFHDLDGPIREPGEWEYRAYIDKDLELWAKFGFVVLDFHGPKIEVRYMNEDGRRPDRRETIE